MQGPKIRVGTIRDGKFAVKADEKIRFVLSGSDGDKNAIPLPHPEIFAAIAPGQDLLIDDGRVRVRQFELEHALPGELLAAVPQVAVGGGVELDKPPGLQIDHAHRIGRGGRRRRDAARGAQAPPEHCHAARSGGIIFLQTKKLKVRCKMKLNS